MKKILLTLALLGTIGLASASASDFSKEKCCKTKKCRQMCKKEGKDCCNGGDKACCAKVEAEAAAAAAAESKSCCKGDAKKSGKACHDTKKAEQ